MRPIDADALMDILADRLDLLGERFGKYSAPCGAVAGAMTLIERQPTIEERKTGRWKHGREVSREYVGTAIVAIRYEHWECSECGYRTDNEPVWKYCPNCGAKMEKTEG